MIKTSAALRKFDRLKKVNRIIIDPHTTKSQKQKATKTRNKLEIQIRKNLSRRLSRSKR